jgi:hypothetical protein
MVGGYHCFGTRWRRGVTRLVMGSDAELVFRTNSVPILLIRSKTPPRHKRSADEGSAINA